MKYFIDTEFHEYKKKPLFGKPIDTIELISIGIISEEVTKEFNKNMFTSDGSYITYAKNIQTIESREYYAISKDFDLKAAWNEWQPTKEQSIRNNFEEKEYWLRENVLRPIYYELCKLDEPNLIVKKYDFNFTYKNLKKLIKKYGKTNKQIAEEIKEFVAYSEEPELHPQDYYSKKDNWNFKDVQFYGYFSAFDYVVFSKLFGDFSKYPNGFPMCFIDLKQTFDEKVYNYATSIAIKSGSVLNKAILDNMLESIKNYKNYPKQTNEHNALADAIWNYELYKFLKTL